MDSTANMILTKEQVYFYLQRRFAQKDTSYSCLPSTRAGYASSSSHTDSLRVHACPVAGGLRDGASYALSDLGGNPVSSWDTTLVCQCRSSGEEGIDFFGTLSSFLDTPNNERLTSSAISSSKDTSLVGDVFLIISNDHLIRRGALTP